MADVANFMMLGNWEKQMNVPFQKALELSQEVFGHTAEKVCRKAIYFMAQSAGKICKKSKGKRDVLENFRFVHLLHGKDAYKAARMAGKDMGRYFKYRGLQLKQHGEKPKEMLANTRQPIEKISHQGMAARSWMWSITGKQNSGDAKAWNDATELFVAVGNQGPYLSGGGDKAQIVKGFILQNRLSYINEAMPSGWRADVEQKAANRLLGEARESIGTAWKKAMESLKPS